jgi:hypothetical protein
MSSKEFSFRMITWSIRTDGLLVPRPGWSSIAGGLLGGAVALGLQQDVLQFAVRIGDSGGVVAKGADGVHHQCRQLEHAPVEFRDGLCDAKVELIFVNHACGASV